jgi:hypothetical protein
MVDDPLIIFLHIPKAAGQTLLSIIARQYGPGFLQVPHGRAVTELSAQQQAQIAIIAGHIPYGVHQYIVRPVSYITILRHPVQRVVSHYHYIWRTPAHYLHARFQAEQPTLRDYALGNMTREMDNGQVRQLHGAIAKGETVSQPDVMIALANLDAHFLVTGLTESFDETLLLLQRRLRWSLPVYESKNTNHARFGTYALDDETYHAITERNQWDMQLYEQASQRFRDDLAQTVPDWQTRALMLHLANRGHRIAHRLPGLPGRVWRSLGRRVKGATAR